MKFKSTNKLVKYLGVDWGEKRIGLAFGDSETKIATPYKVINNIEDLFDVIKKEEIDVVVIGLPKKLDNKNSISSENALDFINKLKNKSGVLIEVVDERLTSKAADALIGGKKTKADRDATAAMLILQTYLDRLN